MPAMSKSDKDYMEGRIAQAQSEIEKIEQHLARIRAEVLNPLRRMLLISMGKEVADD